VLSHYSLRRASWEERLDAAVAGGFDGIGVHVRELQRLRAEGWTDATLLAAATGRGLEVPEVVLASAWGTGDPAGDEPALRAGEALGAAYVQAIAPIDGALVDGVVGFRRLCDQAREAGLAVALEFLPEISAIEDLSTAAAFVTEAGRDNGGLCIDVWHFERGRKDWAALAAVPAERVVMVQLDDGPARRVVDGYLEDCMHHRCLPGDGVFELDRFFATLRGSGWEGYVSVEVMDDDLAGLAPNDLGRRLGEASRAALGR